MGDAETEAGKPAGQDLSALRELLVRTASAVVMIAVVAAALWYDKLTWLVLVALVALGCLYEWSKLAVRAFGGAARAFWLLFGLGYIGVAASGLLALYAIPNIYGEQDMAPLIAVILAVIAVDVGAYLAGRVIGGPKIAPSISPSKTWAGLVGAILAATLVMVQFGRNDWHVAMVGPVIAVVAQAGDFFESWLKRRAGVKDSGALIPGHGGLLDRVDGLIAVAFVFQIVHLVGLAVHG